MRDAFFEYLRLMWRYWWQLAIGVAAGIAGLLSDMEIIPEPLPSWVWWGVAVGTFTLAQFLSFLTLHKEVTSFRDKPRADVSLNAAFNYVHKQAIRDPNLSSPIDAVTNMILGKAIVGDIPIFGTRKNPDDGDGVVEPIDADYWRDHSFFLNELHYFKLSPVEKGKRMRSTGEDPIYYNLRTDTSKVFLCWPQERRFRPQWPFRREIVDVSR